MPEAADIRIQCVLYIDDDEDDLSLFQIALTSLNYDVQFKTVASAILGLSLLKQGEIKPDLIIVDLNIPQFNGFDFLKEIKSTAELSSIPVVVLSTSIHHDDIKQARLLGAKAFITKPNSFVDLCTILRQLLQARYSKS